MPYSLPLITTLASAFGLALIMGFIAVRLKLPPLVGYLLAGVLLGPFTPGPVANTAIASELAEIGVMLLMFGVGLHFSVEQLFETRKIALPGALLQMTVATILGTALATYWGWSIHGALVFGLALSVASTVVLIRALEAQDMIGSVNGQIAIGWLIVEDLAMLFVLVFLPLAAEWFGMRGKTDSNAWLILAITLLKIIGFVVLMLFVGRKLFPKLLWYAARTGSQELFTLSVITAALSIAFAASKLFGMSLALGAFFSGMIIRESRFSQRAAEESLPFRDAFAVLFFVSVGMLFNPRIFIEHPMQILAVLATIVIGKSLAAAMVVLVLRYPLNTALTVSAGLAQIGEFSFILAGLGLQLGLLPVEGRDLILAGALLSITLNPFLFKLIKPVQSFMESYGFGKKTNLPDPLTELPQLTDKKYLSDQVVLVGYGQVGRRIARMLAKQDIPYLVVEEDHELVNHLRRHGIVAVYGNATEPNVLIQAHIAHADMLVIATSDTFHLKQMLNIAYTINPNIEVAVRVKDGAETLLLQQGINAKFFFTDSALAQDMSRYILKRFGITFPES